MRMRLGRVVLRSVFFFWLLFLSSFLLASFTKRYAPHHHFYYMLQSLEAKAQKALDCPCVADLRKGPCGNQFSEAFVCFLKSTTEEKVMPNNFWCFLLQKFVSFLLIIYCKYSISDNKKLKKLKERRRFKFKSWLQCCQGKKCCVNGRYHVRSLCCENILCMEDGTSFSYMELIFDMEMCSSLSSLLTIANNSWSCYCP